MTIVYILPAFDACVIAFVLGLLLGKPVTPVKIAPSPLPQRVPGASFVDNPPPALNGETVLPPYVARSTTIGDRIRARGLTVAEYYRQRFADKLDQTQEIPVPDFDSDVKPYAYDAGAPIYDALKPRVMAADAHMARRTAQLVGVR